MHTLHSTNMSLQPEYLYPYIYVLTSILIVFIKKPNLEIEIVTLPMGLSILNERQIRYNLHTQSIHQSDMSNKK